MLSKKSLEIELKELFSLLVRMARVPAFIREIACRGRVTIISYHDVKPDIFRMHLRYLTKHYNIIALDDLVIWLTSKKDKKPIPEKALVITMDDGFAGNHSLIPVLDEYRVPMTIFTRPDCLESPAGGEDTACRFLNKYQMLELSRHGVSFGSHSMTHRYLTHLTHDDAVREIRDSKKYLEGNLGLQIRHFAYPYGDCSDREVGILKNLHCYESARTTKPGWVSSKSDPYELRCMGVGDETGINKMVLDVSGIFPFLRILRRKFFDIHFNRYKTFVSYITGILNLRGPIAQHTKRQKELVLKYAKGRKRLVEIGVSEGGSALLALRVMDPKGKIWLIDPYLSTFYPFFSLSLAILRRALAKLKDKDVTLLRDFSHNVAIKWQQKIDYLLIDGDHSERGFMQDWKDWNGFLEDDGVVIVQSIRTPEGAETGAGRIVRKLADDARSGWEIVATADATAVLKRKRVHP